ncbi:MAG: translocation/assembly module TamB domain-containing protein [Candidatus Krumholzibacteriota bacterium]|nr:translocation/assembly module TamB domain-containing protein [Candidatus Krumholzibacteriota bacterium]
MKLRSAVKYLFIAGGGLILLIAVLLIFATLPPGEDILRRVIQGRVSAITHQETLIGDLETDIISRLIIRDINIPAPDSIGGGVKIGAVELNYRLKPLLNRKVIIDSIKIRSPRLNIVRDSTGGYNLPLLNSLLAPPEDSLRETAVQGGRWNIEAGAVRITGADISYIDRLVPVNFRLGQILFLAGSPGSGHTGRSARIKIGTGMMKYQTLPEIPFSFFYSGEISEGLIVSDSTRLAVGGFILSVTGSVETDGEYLSDLQLGLQGEPLPVISQIMESLELPVDKIGGRLSAAANLKGPLSFPRGDARVVLPEIHYRGLVFKDCLLKVRGGPDTLAVDTLRAAAAEGVILADGFLSYSDGLKGRADLAFSSVRTENIWAIFREPPSPLRSGLEGHVSLDLNGPRWQEWDVTAEVQSRGTRYMSRPFEDTELSLRLRDRRLNLDFSQEYCRVTGNVILGDSTLEGSVDAGIDRLELLAELLDAGQLSGMMTAKMDIEGTYGSPDLKAEIKAESLQVRGVFLDALYCMGRMEGTEIFLDSLSCGRDSLLVRAAGYFDRISASGRLSACLYDSGRGRVADSADWPEPTDIGKSAGCLDLDFSFPQTGSFYLKGSGRGMDIDALASAVSDTITAGGVAEFEVTARGPVDSLRAGLRLEVERPSCRGVRMDSLRLDSSFENGILRVEKVYLKRAAQSLRGQLYMELAEDDSGGWTVTPGSPTSGRIDVEQFNLEQFGSLFPEGWSIKGLAWIDLDWDGIIFDPKPEGSLRVESAAWGRAGEEAQSVSGINISGTLADSVFILDTAEANVNGTPVSLNGSATLIPENRLKIDLRGGMEAAQVFTARGILSREEQDLNIEMDSLNVRIFEPFVPGVKLTKGQLFASVHLSSTPEKNDITGNIRGRGLEIQPQALDRPVTKGRFLAEFDGGTIRMEALSARLGGGVITGSGYANLDTTGISDISMLLHGRRVGFVINHDLEVNIDSLDVFWERDGAYYKLGGNIDPGKIRYTRNFHPASIMPWTRKTKEVETELPPLLARTRMEIKIAGADEIWIDNNLAHLRSAADLSISGFLADPGISGRLVLEEGYILYLDRKFEVGEGVAFFSDPAEINPDIIFRAVTNVTTYRQTESAEYRISLEITGKAQDPIIKLTADPPLQRSDIVSLLTLGATRAQLTGDTGNVLKDRGKVLASRQITGYAGRKLEKTLGLDRVTVTGKILKPELIMAKKVSEGVTVTYQTTVGHLNEQRINLNWELSRRWMVEGSTSRSGDSSASLTYSLRFR